MKTCSKCKIEKVVSDFPKIGNRCKYCIKIYVKKYNEENKSQLIKNRIEYKRDNKETIKIYQEKYEKINKNQIAKRKKEYKNTHKEQIMESKRRWQENHKEKASKHRNEQRKIKYSTDPLFKIRLRVSNTINKQLKIFFSSKNGKSCLDYLEYTIQELKEHLEKQFEPWMNWNNHGNYDYKLWDNNDQKTWNWQIDHIVPHSMFPYTSMSDDNFKKCWSLDNLRPYSAKQNIIDGTTRIRHSK